LEASSIHTNFDSIIIDEAASTIYISDPETQLDVGAIAKGWSVQRVAETAPKGLLISVGGNVCATGPKDDQGTPWVVGIQDPDGDAYLHTVNVTGGSVVTSGDYQRYYVVDGKPYHHILATKTGWPVKTDLDAVTLIAPEGMSCDIDALSTTCLILGADRGMELIEKKGDIEGIFVLKDGDVRTTKGANFEKED
jgi:thiamine biosynthesis lipoprotein